MAQVLRTVLQARVELLKAAGREVLVLGDFVSSLHLAVCYLLSIRTDRCLRDTRTERPAHFEGYSSRYGRELQKGGTTVVRGDDLADGMRSYGRSRALPQRYRSAVDLCVVC